MGNPRVVRSGAGLTAGALIAATLLSVSAAASTKPAEDSKPADPPRERVQIILPHELRINPPEVLRATDPALAVPEVDQEPAYRDPRYRRLATPEFETFDSEADFRRFIGAVDRLRRSEDRRRYGASDGGEVVVAMLQDAALECTIPEDCPEESGNEKIVVTGSRIAAAPSAMATPLAVTATDSSDASENANITNTQVAAVDEGDIVKLIGQYLLVLQDGRIFAVHYPTLTLTDRQDIYRKDESGRAIGADWYDEMLVEGDQIIVTAYSYEDDATEITVLRLDQESGKVEPRGVFLISSDDYYDVDNYATRIVGDQLVIYTPYEASDLVSRRDRPVIRRWTNAEDFYDKETGGSEVLNVRDIYRPVFGVREPFVHTISVCPLSNVIDKGLECETTGFVGGDAAEMYVTGDAAYLWTSAMGWDEQGWRNCEAGTPSPTFGEVPPAAIFRLPIGRAEMRRHGVAVLGARGMPVDQFGMDATSGRFRALTHFYRSACADYDNPMQFALLNAQQASFRDRYVAAREREFAKLPQLAAGGVENRFVGDYVVYGGRSYYSRRPPRDAEAEQIALANVLHAVPIGTPDKPESISIGHSLIRLERMGNAAVIANGYADESGLRVSYVGLGGEDGSGSGVRSSALLPGRYESEGRSHAFNATYTRAGDGMLGVPTVTRDGDSRGYWWYSDTSDLSFLAFTGEGLLSDAGMILATPEDEVETAEGYDCEVSCIDWYGNARPIFLGGKVYGLMATELVEAEVVEGQVSERRRVDLTGVIAKRP